MHEPDPIESLVPGCGIGLGLDQYHWQNGVLPSSEAAKPGDPSPPIQDAEERARAPQRVLSPGLADGINDAAEFGPDALEITLFDLRGAEVYRARWEGGESLLWRGRDSKRNLVSSGIYAARIKTRKGRKLIQSFTVVK